MNKSKVVSTQTRNNWIIDAIVLIGGLLAVFSGVYFLFLPVGGYQGGRNALYDVTIFFDRSTWDDLHTWGGVVMIIALVVHFTFHWPWVLMMGKRIIKLLRSGGMNMSPGSKFNLAVNLVVALSFLLTAITGIYFLYVSPGGFQGGRNSNWDPGLIFNRTTWDMIHTWAGVIFILAAVVHFAIHWRWAVKVTRRLLGSLNSRLVPRRVQEKTLA